MAVCKCDFFLAEPYMIAFSKSQKRAYFFNTATRESMFDTTKEVIATFE